MNDHVKGVGFPNLIELIVSNFGNFTAKRDCFVVQEVAIRFVKPKIKVQLKINFMIFKLQLITGYPRLRAL